MRGLEGKSIVVTGGGRGLGLRIGERLMHEGCKAALLDLGPKWSPEASELLEAGAVGLSCDVTDKAALEWTFAEIAKRFGAIHGVVNSAMWIAYDPIEAVRRSDVDRMMAVGFTALVNTTQVALPHFRKNPGGSIVNLSSVAAHVGLGNAAAYSAVKGAVAAYTRQLAVELARQHVRVNCISPGPIPTPGSEAVVDETGFTRRRARTPLGRLGRPSDIAAATAFLLSEDAGFITGQDLVVDGGLTLAAAM